MTSIYFYVISDEQNYRTTVLFIIYYKLGFDSVTSECSEL